MRDITPLKQIVGAMTSEVRMIKEFARETGEGLASRKIDFLNPKLGIEDLEEFGRITKWLSAAMSENKGKKGHELSVTTSDKVGELILQVITPIKHRTFLAEMALSYLISHLEAFIKAYTLEILIANPNVLKCNATLTYDEAVTYKSVKQLRRGLAEKEVEILGYGSIDDIENYFKKRFNIVLGQFDKWSQLRENVYRRNIIVHNQGRINDIYRRKLGYKGKALRLTTELEYVIEAADIIEAFIKFTHAEMSKKMKLS